MRKALTSFFPPAVVALAIMALLWRPHAAPAAVWARE